MFIFFLLPLKLLSSWKACPIHLELMKNFGPLYSTFLEPSHWIKASSNSRVCGSPMNEKMQHLSRVRNTGIFNYSVPGRLWCLGVAICRPSSSSSTGPMVSFKQGDCDCLAKTRYNASHQDFYVYSLFCVLQEQWAGYWFIQKFRAQISEQWF